MTRVASLFALVAWGLSSIGTAAEEPLNIGDAAPLAVSSWVKGEKFDKFEPGKTYVVEFWATWCGPCRASIPHLTELAHQFKDKGVRFVGVDVWEHDTKLVQPFLEEMGDKMDYNVALDTVTEGGNPSDGAMAKTWMQAADEHGIPCAFVVRDGKIAWIGHPMSLEEPLTKIVADEWNLAEMGKKRLADKLRERKLAAVREKIFAPIRAKDYKATVAAIDEAVGGDAELADALAPYKFAALCNGGEIEPGLQLGAKLLEKYNDNAAALNNYFWEVIDPALKHDPDPRVAQLALKAARRAVDLTKEADANNLDTLAEALFRTGDAAAAALTEEKAIKVLKAQLKDGPDAQLKEFTDHLARYRNVAAVQ